MRKIKCFGILFGFFVLCLVTSGTAEVFSLKSENDLTKMHQVVIDSSTPSPLWAGPLNGPAGVTGKNIAIIAEDLRNGGILGVAQGIGEAAQVLRWHVHIFDAGEIVCAGRIPVRQQLPGRAGIFFRPSHACSGVRAVARAR